HEEVSAEEQTDRSGHADLDEKSSDRGGQKRNGRKQHQTFVCVGSPSLKHRRGHQNTKDNDVADRYCEEVARIAARRSTVPLQGLYGQGNAHQKHRSSKDSAGNSKAAMNIRAMSRHERRLRNEQANPCHEERAMNVIQERQRRKLGTAQEIAR